MAKASFNPSRVHLEHPGDSQPAQVEVTLQPLKGTSGTLATERTTQPTAQCFNPSRVHLELTCVPVGVPESWPLQPLKGTSGTGHQKSRSQRTNTASTPQGYIWNRASEITLPENEHRFNPSRVHLEPSREKDRPRLWALQPLKGTSGTLNTLQILTVSDRFNPSRVHLEHSLTGF